MPSLHDPHIAYRENSCCCRAHVHLCFDIDYVAATAHVRVYKPWYGVAKLGTCNRTSYRLGIALVVLGDCSKEHADRKCSYAVCKAQFLLWVIQLEEATCTERPGHCWVNKCRAPRCCKRPASSLGSPGWGGALHHVVTCQLLAPFSQTRHEGGT